LTHLFKYCLRLSHFPNPWKEAKIITLPKPGKDPKFPQNLQQEEVIQNYDNKNVRTIRQGEARHRKYKRLKLGGGQAYDRSSD
jgi:hypothetical protein